jgi:hypothetical protein
MRQIQSQVELTWISRTAVGCTDDARLLFGYARGYPTVCAKVTNCWSGSRRVRASFG